jgi:hypothetical protein
MRKYLKGQCHELSTSGFFHESVSHKPLSIPLEPFQIFPKIRRYIRSSRCTTGVVDVEKIFKLKIFNYFIWTPLGSRVNIYINFCLQVQCLQPDIVPIIFIDTGGKFAAGVVDTSGNLPPA